MLHYKAVMLQRTSKSKRYCAFNLFPEFKPSVRGVYDRRNDKFYALNKNSMPHKKGYKTLKLFASAHGCKSAKYAERYYINGKSLIQLHGEDKSLKAPRSPKIPKSPKPSPAAAASSSVDNNEKIIALKLQMAVDAVDNAAGVAVSSSIRLRRAKTLFDNCTVRLSRAEDELIIARNAHTDALKEVNDAQQDDDWEQEALEDHKETLAAERRKYNIPPPANGF